MNQSQNQIVESLIGPSNNASDTTHGLTDGNLTNDQINRLCGFPLNFKVHYKIINDFLSAKSSTDMESVQNAIRKGLNAKSKTTIEGYRSVLRAIDIIVDRHKAELPHHHVSVNDMSVSFDGSVGTPVPQSPMDDIKPHMDTPKTPETDGRVGSDQNANHNVQNSAPMSPETDGRVGSNQNTKHDEQQDKHIEKLEDEVKELKQEVKEDHHEDQPAEQPKEDHHEEHHDQVVEKPRDVPSQQPKSDIPIAKEFNNETSLPERKLNKDDVVKDKNELDRAQFERSIDAIKRTVEEIQRQGLERYGENESQIRTAVNSLVNQYLIGRLYKGHKIIKRDPSYDIPMAVRIAHKDEIKRRLDEVLTPIGMKIAIASNGRPIVTSKEQIRYQRRRLKDLASNKVIDEETFFTYDINYVYDIIEDFVRKHISKRYVMSDEAKMNINALMNNETKRLSHPIKTEAEHGVINSKFIDQLSIPIEQYINSKMNRGRIASSQRLSPDEKLMYLKKFHISPMSKSKLEQILLRDTKDLHVDKPKTDNKTKPWRKVDMI